MSNLSNFTITLDRSWDFLKLSALIHLFAGILIYRSSFAITAIALLIFILTIHFFYLLYHEYSGKNLCQIHYYGKKWHLLNRNHKSVQFERMDIVFHGGLFRVIELSGLNQKKRLVIFNDQVAPHQLKKLYILRHLP
ncbi:hypothetical protein [Legionella londiniensis]|uniref:Transmembrane protein n=1 Tax=Legionella londiniensis TaxID=45068 RepID=A0A0W0VM25_9GAMM|nr:hypothetical protein [Legionella londiniensis]KTD21156.1 hypothetical protein Llon_1254 [Legionella londiniensis]STX93178.1 Uncharacterised protein [Legionella londiniensis]